MTQFNELGLSAPLIKTLEALDYTTPTPIQTKAIPIVLSGRDLLGIAQTGTGKTAAFALPVLHHLNLTQKDGERRRGSVRGLVLAPTRELAVQINESARAYGKLLGLRIDVVTGGVPIGKQIKNLAKGTDLLIATPGRLEDLMAQKAITLDHVTHLVLDEADQMLDMGFIHVLKRIAKALPKERQTLLFSATMPKEIEALAGQFLTNPDKVSVAPVSATADRVNQLAYFVPQKSKPVLLARLLKDREVTRAIVFTRTKHGANRLVKQLDATNLDALAIHGNKTQAQRQKALNAFRDGECAILVATDVAARGIDIPEVSHVFNYEIPDVPEQYVHRIGRTARAGRAGEAVSLICDAERKNVRDIERLTKVPLKGLPLPEGFTNNLAEDLAEMVSAAPPPRGRGRFSDDDDSEMSDRPRRPRAQGQGRGRSQGSGPARNSTQGKSKRPQTGRPMRAGGDREFSDLVASMGASSRSESRSSGQRSDQRSDRSGSDRPKTDRPRGDGPRGESRGSRGGRPSGGRPNGKPATAQGGNGGGRRQSRGPRRTPS